MNETPNYILKTNEKVDIPTNNNKIFPKLRIAVWFIVGIIILGSLFFGDNLLSEMSWTTRIILLSLIIGIGFYNPREPQPSELEIWFYDDYFTVYREKRYYSKKVSRMEFNKFFYSNIDTVEYDYRLKRLDIIGKIDATWFDYNKDGSVPKIPTYHRIIDGGICYFYIYGNDEEDILNALEYFTKKNVIRKNQ